MAATSGKMLSQGARHCRLYALNATGSPLAASTSAAYAGIPVETIKGFNMNAIEPRKFTHVGQDRPLGIDYLPPTEAIDGEITVGGDEFAVYSLASGVATSTIGEAKGIHIATSKLGYEPMLGMMVYQKAKDLDTGLDRWRVFISAAAKLFFLSSGMTENATELRYKVAPNISKINLWETALAEGTDGCTSAQGLYLMTEGKPEFISYLGDGTVDDFILVVGQPALTAAKIVVWVSGVLQVITTDYTVAVDKASITFAGGKIPATGARIDIFYEW